MHPSFYYRWKCARRAAEAEMRAACGDAAGRGEGPGEAPDEGRGRGRGRVGAEGWWAGGREGAGPYFGVRRPLRFMAHRLGLDDEQVQTLARILNDIKTERAQVEVDDRRAVGQIADALDTDELDVARVEAALRSRVESAERLEKAVMTVLRETHALLNREQRAQLAYMLRSGQLTI